MIKGIASTTNYRNAYYKSDTEYATRVAKTLLTPIGIWPRDDPSSRNVKLYIQAGFMFSLMCFLLIPHAIYTYVDCEDLTRYMKVIAAQAFSLLAIIKFWTMILNREDIKLCLSQMETQYRDVESEEDRMVMTNCAKIGRFFTKLYLGLSYGGALPYHIVLPFMSEKIVKEDNSTQLPLPYLSDYVVFVIEDSPIYEIVFVSQIIVSILILSTNCGIYSLMASVMMHSCGLFEITNRRIEVDLTRNRRDLRERLRRIVRHHLKAIEYSFVSNRTLSMFIRCVMLFYMRKSERVGETMYFIPWYDFPETVTKDVRTTILRTSQPSKLSGAKLFDLSLQAFCDA